MAALYPDDAELGRRVLGPKRAHLWKSMLPELERRGFPPVSALYGGRYWPAVVAFFDRENGVASRLEGGAVVYTIPDRSISIRPFAPDGPEDHRASEPPPAFRRRSRGHARRAGA
jgi:hypothetical protein